ncbi:MAG: replication factor C large subunit [Thermoplasmata archaeon]|nr:MAG: replication factor C large subunit [Thermoplasmata archaeon]
MEGLPWMEKYRPRRLQDVVGNPKALRELRKWAESFKGGRPKKPGVILYGPPGVGKTSAALALAEEYEWVPIELNASDARNMEAIRRVATRGSMTETFSQTGEFMRSSEGRRKIIILDEVDNLYEGGAKGAGGEDLSDRGGKRAILELLKLSHHPVVLICNDLYGLTRGAVGKAIEGYCVKIKFNNITKAAVKMALRRILQSEGIAYEEGVLDALAERAEGDLRAAVVDLETVALGRRELTMQELEALGYRDKKKNIFQVLAKIFRSNSLELAREAVAESDESPDMLLAWIIENIPVESRGRRELYEGYYWASMADVMLGRARWKGHWRMWAYAMDFMSGGVSTALKGGAGGFVPYRFPSWILKMSSSKDYRALMKSVGRKIGGITHSSISDVTEACLGPYRILFRRSRDFAVYVAAQASLTAEEVSFISGGEIPLSEAREIVEEARKLRESRARPHHIGGRAIEARNGGLGMWGKAGSSREKGGTSNEESTSPREDENLPQEEGNRGEDEAKGGAAEGAEKEVDGLEDKEADKPARRAGPTLLDFAEK